MADDEFWERMKKKNPQSAIRNRQSALSTEERDLLQMLSAPGALAGGLSVREVLNNAAGSGLALTKEAVQAAFRKLQRLGFVTIESVGNELRYFITENGRGQTK